MKRGATGMVIWQCGEDPVVGFAARELARCLRRMTAQPARVRKAPPGRPPGTGIVVGLLASADAASCGADCPADRWEDRLVIRSAGGRLILTGSNPRSVLFAVYRWLEQLGARWIRPGRDGELLPPIRPPVLSGWEVDETADCRHRGIVIEGANAIEQVLDMVDWMPKVGMNAYMLQFRVSAYFWRRYYERADLPSIRDPHLLSIEECAALDARVAAAVRQRGLLLHRVGHGWTCSTVGFPEVAGWETAPEPPEDVRPLLAEVKGRRGWFGGAPINTELCYGNPEARRRFVDTVIAYAAAHPGIDVLHVWLSDGTNNMCECPLCAEKQPTDWYVTLLNEISPRLLAAAPRMKLAALCYSNTMWPPTSVAPDRLGDNVILMFAPISRCYGHAILDPRCTAEPPPVPYTRNAVTTPRANGDYAAMLRAWQRYLPPGTDAFAFDYPLWQNFPNEWLGMDAAALFAEEVGQYRGAGVNGILSCQLQRAFVPTSLGQHALAHWLWNCKAPLAPFVDRFFVDAFGSEGSVAQDFYHAFTAANGPRVHGNAWWETDANPERVAAVRRVLREYTPRLREAAARGRSLPSVQRRSWSLLLFFVAFQTRLWQALEAAHGIRPSPGLAERRFAALDAYLARAERRLYRWIDASYWRRFFAQVAKAAAKKK